MSVSFGSDGSMTANYDDELTVIGSAFPVMAASALPSASADNAGQIVAITDFGYPYVLVQSSGSVWKQLTHFYTTWAALPSATTFLGFVGYITDFFGGFRVIARAAAGGNYWRPLNPVKLISYAAGEPATTLGPDSPTVDHTLVANTALPNPGFILIGDNIVLDNFHARGGTLASAGPAFSVRMGTSATPASNPEVVSCKISGSSSTIQRSNHKAFIVTNTLTRTIQPGGTGVSAGTLLNDRTITDITTASQFISLTVKAGGTAETITPYAIEVYLFPTV